MQTMYVDRAQAAQPFLLRLLNNSIKMIFASFFDGLPVVERARIYILGSLCIEMYDVGIPVCVLRDAPARAYGYFV